MTRTSGWSRSGAATTCAWVSRCSSTTVRYLGTFLTDPLDVPPVVLEHLAGQLEIADPSCVKRYTERRTTPFEHREEIKAAYGLREFAEAEAEFAAWVRARAWNTGDGPKTIFGDGVQWLRSNAVLLPGVTTLARLVARVRDEATRRPVRDAGRLARTRTRWPGWRAGDGARGGAVLGPGDRGARGRRSRAAGTWSAR